MIAVALLGAITHQALAAWVTVDVRPGSFVGRFRSVPSTAPPICAKPSVKRESIDYETLDRVFRLGVDSGYLDDALLGPLCLLSTRRIGILPWIRGSDFGTKHGVDIIRVNGIVFDKKGGIYRRVPYKTDESLRFFVLHSAFRKWGFVDWAIEQGDNFLFRMLQICKDPSDTASDRINKLLKKGGAAGMNIEVGQSLRHGGKDMLIEEDVDTQTTRLQMGHRASDPHAGYGTRSDLLAIVGPNASGKTAVLQALCKLFGVTRAQRTVRRSDFHLPPGVPPDDRTTRSMSMDVIIALPELAKGSATSRTVAPAFRWSARSRARR